MLSRLRALRPSSRPNFLMMPSWFATPFVESLLFVLSAAEHHGIRCIAHKGLLLGALRLEGVLPWDDDSDVFLVDESREDVEAELRGTLERHGFRLRFVERDYYFWAYPRIWLGLPLGGLTELGLLTRTGTATQAVYDDHEPGRRLTAAEILPLRRYPFHGSYLMGPNQAEVAVDRMYGPLATAEAFARFRRPRLAPGTEEFWHQTRPIDGDVDWERISSRFMERKRSVAFQATQLPCSAWWIANRAYWLGMDGLRTVAGGSR